MIIEISTRGIIGRISIRITSRNQKTMTTKKDFSFDIAKVIPAPIKILNYTIK
jgi:hypothetical protein